MEVVAVAIPPDPVLEHAVHVGSADLFWVCSDEYSIRCNPARAEGKLKLLTAVEGSLELRQGERRALLTPGCYAWVNADERFEVVAERGRQLQLRLPAEWLESRHPNLDLRPAIARGIDHPGERVVRGLLRGLGVEGRSLSPRACAAGLGTLLEALGMGPRRSTDALLERRLDRARHDVESRLGDPGLQPGDVARRQGVSRRYLDSLFRRGLGVSLSDYIRNRRLDRAAHDLIVSGDQPSSEIGARYGFRDASHFSRAFRRRFDRTPGRYRADASPGQRRAD